MLKLQGIGAFPDYVPRVPGVRLRLPLSASEHADSWYANRSAGGSMPGNFPKPLLNSDAAVTHGASVSRAQARALALEAGFAEAGLVELPHADEERDAARFEEWVRAGRAGTMRYLERRETGPESEATGQEDEPLLRSRARIPFPWARSVLVCLANYNSRQPRSTEPAAEGAGWIARYAWTGRMESGKVDASGAMRPTDYHKVLLKRM